MKPLSIATLSTLSSLRTPQEKQEKQAENATDETGSSADSFAEFMNAPDDSLAAQAAGGQTSASLRVLRWADMQADEGTVLADGAESALAQHLLEGRSEVQTGARAPSETVLNWRKSLRDAIEGESLVADASAPVLGGAVQAQQSGAVLTAAYGEGHALALKSPINSVEESHHFGGMPGVGPDSALEAESEDSADALDTPATEARRRGEGLAMPVPNEAAVAVPPGGAILGADPAPKSGAEALRPMDAVASAQVTEPSVSDGGWPERLWQTEDAPVSRSMLAPATQERSTPELTAQDAGVLRNMPLKNWSSSGAIGPVTVGGGGKEFPSPQATWRNIPDAAPDVAQALPAEASAMPETIAPVAPQRDRSTSPMFDVLEQAAEVAPAESPEGTVVLPSGLRAALQPIDVDTVPAADAPDVAEDPSVSVAAPAALEVGAGGRHAVSQGGAPSLPPVASASEAVGEQEVLPEALNEVGDAGPSQEVPSEPTREGEPVPDKASAAFAENDLAKQPAPLRDPTSAAPQPGVPLDASGGPVRVEGGADATAVSRSAAARVGASHGLGHQVAEALVNAPNRGVELTLAPEELGKVRMTLHAQEGSMSVAVQAERPETLDLMRRHIDSLAREFREMGYADVSFDFGQQSNPQRQPQEPLAEAPRAPEPTSAGPLLSAEAPAPAEPEGAAGGLDLRM